MILIAVQILQKRESIFMTGEQIRILKQTKGVTVLSPRKRAGERPDGLVQVSIQNGFRPDGKPNRKYFYGHTRAEAIQKRDAYKATLVGHKHNPHMTLSQWVDAFKASYRTNVNPAYLSIDDVPYNRLVKTLGYMPIQDIRETHLQQALNEVKGMSYSTADKYRQCIKRVFLKAQKNKIIRDNPAEGLILPPSTRGTHRALEREEIELILQHWNNPYAPAGLWILIMLLTGLRKGEMIALDWSAIDLGNRTLAVRQTAVANKNKITIEQRAKSDAGLRVIPVCSALFDALSSIPTDQRTGFVCKSAQGKLLTPQAAKRGLEQFCAVMTRIVNNQPAENPVRLSAGKKKEAEELKQSPAYQVFTFRYHDLRHTYATALYDAGVPVKAAQYFLGHADIRITLDLYTHLSREREHASRQQLIQLFDSWVSDRSPTPQPHELFGYISQSEQPDCFG